MNAYGAKAQHGMPVRPGMTVPLPGHLNTHRDRLIELADMGYTDIWSAEADGADAFTPLALASAWEPRLRLGTAIVPAYTRSPACFAQSVATLADAAPGRFAIGIGSSSNVIVQKWNGIPFDEPYKKVRDVVRFLNDALSGEKVTKQYDTFNIDGFRLGIRPEVKPQILVAALREGMLRLAAREALRTSRELQKLYMVLQRARQKRLLRESSFVHQRTQRLCAPLLVSRSLRISTCRCMRSSMHGLAVVMNSRACGICGRQGIARQLSQQFQMRLLTNSSSMDRQSIAAIGFVSTSTMA
jgi:hypothetical protein